MKERQILFNAPMVQATLAGSKTQTRREAKHPAIATTSYIVDCGDGWFGDEEGDVQVVCPYGRVGDQLWVRETVGIGRATKHAYFKDTLNGRDHKALFDKLTPSIHMPRWASRIQLEITNIRVERLQDISETDAIAEGIERVGGNTSVTPWRNYRIGQEGEMQLHCSAPSRSYMTLWESINGAGSWQANPWVWVVEFKVIKP